MKQVTLSLFIIFLISFSCSNFAMDNPNDPENLDYRAPRISSSKGKSKMIRVEWKVKQKNVHEFILYRGEDRDNLSELIRIESSRNYYEDRDSALVPGSTYYYAVKAVPAPGEFSRRSSITEGYVAFENNSFIVARSDQNCDEESYKIAVDNEGNIFVAGLKRFSPFHIDMILYKYTPQGQLDRSFGNDGKVVYHNPVSRQSSALALGLAIDRKGRIVLTGYGTDYTVSGSTKLFIWRYRPDGLLDTSFNDTGIVLCNYPGTSQGGEEVVVTEEGKILVAGDVLTEEGDFDIAIWRFNNDGSPDLSFGPDQTGYLTHSNAAGGNGDDRAMAMVVDSRKRLIVAGKSISSDKETNDAVIWRFTPEGEPDRTFNSMTGYRLLKFSSGSRALHDFAESLTLDSDDNIIVGGYTRIKIGKTLGTKIIYICKITREGVFDTAFNNNQGVFFFLSPEGYSGKLNRVIVDRNNAIYAAGTLDHHNSDSLIFKLTPRGILDTAFKGCGYVRANNFAGGNSHDRLIDITLTHEETIIGTGFSSNGQDEDLFFIKYDTAAQ